MRRIGDEWAKEAEEMRTGKKPSVDSSRGIDTRHPEWWDGQREGTAENATLFAKMLQNIE